MRPRLHRLLALPAAERRILAQAWFLLLAVDIGLRLLPFPALRRRLAQRTLPPAPPPEQIEPAIRRTASLVNQAARHHLYPMTCLRRSLSLQWLLAGQGIQTELRFGVRPGEGMIQAHAWLERDGMPVSEPEVMVGMFAKLAGRSLPEK